MSEAYDVIIVGGGMVGSGLALALESTGLKLALIEAKLPSHNDPRLFALNDNSCQFLKNLGLWPALTQFACPIKGVHVSKKGAFGALRLNHHDLSLPSLGHVIPAKCIEYLLNEKLNNHSDLKLYRPAKLIAIDKEKEKVSLTIEMDSGLHTIQGSIIIGADGTESSVRQLSKIETEVIDYEQSAIVTRTSLMRSHHHIAYERFIEDGAIAMLPLCSQEDNIQCATIWSGSHKSISALMQKEDSEFLSCLQHQFGTRLGQLKKIDKRFVFPLKKVLAKTPSSGPIYLLGNALHTLHPIAAQGFNLALYEVAALADIVRENKKIDLSLIRSKVQKQQSLSFGLSDHVLTLFKHKPFSLAAQLGMISVDLLPMVKRQLMKKIMGRAGSIPHLLLSNHHHEKIIQTSD